MIPLRQSALPIDVLEAAAQAGVFGKFLAAVTAAEVTDQLTGPGPITLFAPTDAAFALFPEKTWTSFVENQRSLLRNVLTCHFVQGLITVDDFTGKNANVKTVQGASFVVESEGKPHIGGATITHPGIEAENGIVHGIDAMLWFAASVRPTRDRDNKRDAGRGGGRSRR